MHSIQFTSQSMLIMLQHDREIQPEDSAVQEITSCKIRADEKKI